MKEITPIITTVMEQVREGILITDEKGNVRCANDAALELLNLPANTKPRNVGEIKSCNLVELISVAEESEGQADGASQQNGNFITFDHALKGRDAIRHLRFRTGVCNVPGSSNRFRAIMIQDRTGEQHLDSVLNFRRGAGMVTDDPAMLEVLSEAIRIAESDASILLQGESGTGKTLLARMIHKHSKRKDERFVEVSCAAIPDALVESELFGHVRGAFTSAISDRQGRFQAAHNGTIFLDEVGEIPINLQSKLLRALQDQEFEKVGSDQTVQVDVRVISASNRVLRDAVDEERFRPDLYYRLAVIPIYIPPLRERPGDVPLLIKHFYQGLAERGYPEDIGFSHDAISKMMDYPWPGNVRELANAVEHGIICAKGKVVTDASLPKDIRDYGGTHDSRRSGDRSEIEEQDRERINAVLRKVDGSRSEAAEELGIDRSTLWRKMKRLGIDPQKPGPDSLDY